VAENQNIADRDGGFTLTELLIVIVIMGVLMTTLSSVITVVLRTTPPTEARTEDARSLQGLVTWLPQDVDATPPDGFGTDPNTWLCSGTAPAGSRNLLSLEWTETATTVTNYAASYRYELNGGKSRVVRHVCNDGGNGAMGASQRINLTGGLPSWGTPAPATVTMCSTPVPVGQTCPLASVIAPGNTSPGVVKSLRLRITMFDGSFSTIDAAPKNPDKSLADDPDASTNARPVVIYSNRDLQMHSGATLTLDLRVAPWHRPSDPDPADAGLLSVAIDSSEPMPANITASTADPLFVTITASPTAPVGVIADPLVLIISDDGGAWVDVTIDIEILPTANTPPYFDPPRFNAPITMQKGSSVTFSLADSNGVGDLETPLNQLTASVDGSFPAPANITTSIPPTGLDVTLSASNSGPAGTLGALMLIIADGDGGTVSVQITITTFTGAVTNNPPTVSPSNYNVEMFAGASLPLSLYTTHGASDLDLDPLSVAINGSAAQPSDITTTIGAGLDVTLVAGPTSPVGVKIPVQLIISDIHGATVAATITVTIKPSPPPPSNCVLGSLTASPNPVARHSSGSGARQVKFNVTVTLTYTGSCDGLTLTYDTGDTSGLGIGTGRVFPPGSPSSISIVSFLNGGTEKWTPAAHTLTAKTTSAVTPASKTVVLIVT
jgi:prepilin-type N-terminal cleavage/methylation domain-containing protein